MEHEIEEEGRMVRIETLLYINSKELRRVRDAIEGNSRPGLKEEVAEIRGAQRAQKKAGAVVAACLSVAVMAWELASAFLL